MQISGTAANPLLNGDLQVARGEYSFNGKGFNLTQGTIHFGGNSAKKTSLYVVASKDIDRIRAEIDSKGPTNKLAVSFRSDRPSLNEKFYHTSYLTEGCRILRPIKEIN